MRSAPCASAPSHPLHAMPPRITRNSDRPRASDRTMVDIRPACRVFHTRTLPPAAEKAYENGTTSRTSSGNETEWAGPRERTSIFRSRRSFFLDIPFYRTHSCLVSGTDSVERVGLGVGLRAGERELGFIGPYDSPRVATIIYLKFLFRRCLEA